MSGGVLCPVCRRLVRPRKDASGKRMTAFADKLSTEPRAGLEVTEVADST